MSQPDANQNEPSRMKKLLGGGDLEESPVSPLSRLPKGTGGAAPKKPAPAKIDAAPMAPPAKSKPKKEAKPKSDVSPPKGYGNNKFLPAFWTIASVISMLVNIGVVIALVVVIQLLGGTQAALSFAQSLGKWTFGRTVYQFRQNG